MKLMPLTKGYFVMVDDEDFELLSKWKWTWHHTNVAHRGISINGKQKNILMHRQIMNPPADKDIDHIDGNRLNNQRSNLRICTTAQNMMNQKKHSHGKCKYKGVYIKKSLIKSPYAAQIRVNQRAIHLGYHSTQELAAEAYNKAANKYFGEYALLNVITNG